MIYYVLPTEKEAGNFRLMSQGKIPKGRVESVGYKGFDEHKFTEQDVVVCIGYASGYKVEVGALVEPVYAIDAWTREVIRMDTIFPLEHRMCYTSGEKVDVPSEDFASIYDTELFGIAVRPHKRIHAIKIIRDNIGGGERKEFKESDQWKKAIELIGRYVIE